MIGYTFDYGIGSVDDLAVLTGERGRNGLPSVDGVRFRDEVLKPTPRFWRSFFQRFGLSETVFRYFSYGEVFERVVERNSSTTFRYCIERSEKRKNPRLLAITSPHRPALPVDDAMGIIAKYHAEEPMYHDGVVRSHHVPRSGDAPFTIGADDFRQRFVLDVPIDGYGQPKIHLALLRMLCSNGAVGYAPAFRSEIGTGGDVAHSLTRALETFDNGEGYAALRQRFEMAQKSWCSLHEAQTLYRTLTRLRSAGHIPGDDPLPRFFEVTGRVHELYGLANLDALSVKRQRVLPAKCRVYDLVNFASEVATHHADPLGNHTLQGYLGNLISDEYDMEGTAEKMQDFSDFFLPTSQGHASSSRN